MILRNEPNLFRRRNRSAALYLWIDGTYVRVRQLTDPAHAGERGDRNLPHHGTQSYRVKQQTAC